MGRLVLALVLCVLAAPGPGRAAIFDVRVEGRSVHVHLDGEIVKGDFDRLQRAYRVNGYITRLSFNSPGGNLVEALKMGRFVREHAIATHVPADAVCLSACPYIFMGGVVRDAHASARLGMHMASVSGSDGAREALLELLVNEEIDVETKLRHAINLFEQLGAIGLLEQVFYMLDMGVSPRLLYAVTHTDHFQMYVFDREELIATNLVNY